MSPQPADNDRPAILVVEDDENLRLALADNLDDEGFRTVAVANGRDGLETACAGDFDLIVLDIMLPGLDGYSVCREYRAAGGDAMVLMLTARTLEDDLVQGFDAGADDYLAKPYRLRELLARVKALLRRRAAAPPRPADDETATFGGVTLDKVARTVTADGGEVQLTRTEFDLLAYFVARAGQALSRDAILDAVWGADVIVDPRTVDNFVSNLKKKLGWKKAAPWRFSSVRGVGYRMEID